jgi:hypothetical protein
MRPGAFCDVGEILVEVVAVLPENVYSRGRPDERLHLFFFPGSEKLCGLRLHAGPECVGQRDTVGGEALEQQRPEASVLLPGLRFAQQAAEILADIAVALAGELGVDVPSRGDS